MTSEKMGFMLRKVIIDKELFLMIKGSVTMTTSQPPICLHSTIKTSKHMGEKPEKLQRQTDEFLLQLETSMPRYRK